MGQETMVASTTTVPLLPREFRPKIQHKKARLTHRTLVEQEALIVVVNSEEAAHHLQQCPNAKLVLRLYARAHSRGKVSTLKLHDPDTAHLLALGFVTADISPFEQLSLGAKLWKEIESHGAANVAIATLGFNAAQAETLLNAVLAAVLAGAAPLPSYKTKSSQAGHEKQTLESVTLLSDAGMRMADSMARTAATQTGNHLARWLTTLPPNMLNCGSYKTALQQLARQQRWQAEFFDLATLNRFKAGAFLAVARANANRHAGILRLRYNGNLGSRNTPAVTLVGKGICFDTGGINLKPHKSMYDMHTDMQGSAIAVGTLRALTQLNVPFAVECWLALTENEIGPNAYRPQEVVTACNGITIQVVHSDAEGRMALADTLALAARAKPKLMIDFGTLTGACIAALGERMSGAFSNRPGLRDAIERAGRDSGERVWSFPMDADYDSELDSPLADIMQCTLDNKADHILAARFLNRFVPDSIPWVHIDLSAASRHGGLAHIGTEITGFGVRWAVEFVCRHVLRSQDV